MCENGRRYLGVEKYHNVNDRAREDLLDRWGRGDVGQCDVVRAKRGLLVAVAKRGASMCVSREIEQKPGQ